MPQLDTSFFASQVFWSLVSFGTLFSMMSFVVLPRIARTIERRRRMLEAELDEASVLVRRAERIRAEGEAVEAESRRRAAAETEAILSDARLDIASREADTAGVLRERKVSADRRLDHIRAAAADELDAAAAELIAPVISAIGMATGDGRISEPPDGAARPGNARRI